MDLTLRVYSQASSFELPGWIFLPAPRIEDQAISATDHRMRVLLYYIGVSVERCGWRRITSEPPFPRCWCILELLELYPPPPQIIHLCATATTAIWSILGRATIGCRKTIRLLALTSRVSVTRMENRRSGTLNNAAIYFSPRMVR